MMNTMIRLKSYAKINLFLNIGERLDNGYHSIETIFQTINLFDEIRIERLNEPIFRIRCNHQEVPIGKDSIVYRAIETIMKNESIKNKNLGLDIFIHKNIPIASGLGGGSSNIATILLGICKLFRLKMSSSELRGIAIHFGMDIPFFIERGTVFAKGRGEILFPLMPIHPPIHMILINPGIPISTEWAYKTFDEDPINRSYEQVLDRSYLINQKKPIQLYEIGKIVYNRFDATISKRYPIVSLIKEQLKKTGALVVSLSGSGPTIFGIFENKRKLNEVFSRIKDQYPFVYKTSTVRARNIFLKNIAY